MRLVLPSVFPSGRTWHSLEEVHSRRLEHRPYPTEAEEENPKVVPCACFAVGALVSCARGLGVHRLAHDAQGEEDVRANLTRVGRRFKKAELNRALAPVPKVVKVQGAVASFAVMAKAGVDSVVVGIAKARHRRGAEPQHLVYENAVGASREMSKPRALRSASANNQLLLLVKNLYEVLDLLRRHVRSPNVDVEARSATRPRTRSAEGANYLLHHRDVREAQNRAYRFASASHRGIRLAVPFVSIGHLNHPILKVPTFVSVSSAYHLCDRFGGLPRGNPIVLEFNPEGQLAQLCFR